MKQILVYCSADPYSHDLVLYKQFQSNDDNTDYSEYLANYRAKFQTKAWSALYLLGFIFNPKTGTMECVLNEYGEHPLKERLEINPKAAELRKKTPQKTKALFDDLANIVAPAVVPFPEDNHGL